MGNPYTVTGFIGRGGGQFLAPVVSMQGLEYDYFPPNRVRKATNAEVAARQSGRSVLTPNNIPGLIAEFAAIDVLDALAGLPIDYNDTAVGGLYWNNGTLTRKE